MPAPFRRALLAEGAERVVVTLLDQCLAVYAPQEWGRLEGQLAAMPAFSRQVKALTRVLASRAVDCDLDVQGRILLPASLRQAAGLAREAVVIGALARFEIWAPETWDSFLRESERLLDDVSFDLQWPPHGPPAGTLPEGSSEPPHPQGKPNR